MKLLKKQNKEQDAYFPSSAVMYSSQEIVLGAGAVSDCLLAGWEQESQVPLSSIFTVLGTPLRFTNGWQARTHNSLSHLEIVFADAASFT